MTHHDVPSIVKLVVTATVQDIGSDADVTDSSQFGPDLGMDMLDVDYIVMEVESITQVTIPNGEIDEQSTVSDLSSLVLGLLREKNKREALPPMLRKSWTDFPAER